jgi:hypothetical protein
MCNPACHFLKSGQWSGFDADEGMERLLLGGAESSSTILCSRLWIFWAKHGE